ncbi:MULTISPECIES: hypothetical protein [Pseudomonadota]|uniref:hypothetical protein n=2 Tax=Pseudomonadota TaxID=1224 RepID=UPI00076A9137|nr:MULTISPECIES: hypothetical protein [Pseudomonadota]MAF61301.1 hypothetical protein [Blastomonas sp.]
MAPRYYAMFAPLLPIQSDSRASATIDSLLARIDAIGTVLAILARWSGRSAAEPVSGLSERAALAAWLTQAEPMVTARMATELDAACAALQAGLAALEQARGRGHRAEAAAALLYRESRQAFADVLKPTSVHPEYC